MLNGLYSASSALNLNFRNQDIVAHNIAHVNVPGFKRILASVASANGRPEASVRVVDARGAIVARNINGARMLGKTHDFTQGRIEETGLPLNVAINGNGFFEVQQDGASFYTRNGDFQINTQGQLSLSSGQLVMGESGPINMPTDGALSDLRILPDGQITNGFQSVGKIKLVDFENPALLTQMGTTLFAAGPNAVEIPADGQLQQHYLESSNAQAVSELVQMITGMRHFEAAQKALTTISEAIQRHALQGNN